MPEPREVTFFTGAHRRPSRVGELPTGEKLPFNGTHEQVGALLATGAVGLLVAVILRPITGGLGFAGALSLAILAYHVIGAIQTGGNAPAVAAYNAYHTLVGWTVHKLRRLERPERFDGNTRVWRDQ